MNSPVDFAKMHGLGNDYVYVDGNQFPVDDAAALARWVSDRHVGVGSDGLIVVEPVTAGVDADVRMRMFNADGSESEMCGNGIRCVAKYVYDHGIATKDQLTIETGRGVLSLQLQVEHGKAKLITVDMGQPILDAPLIPTTLGARQVIAHSVEFEGQQLAVTCVSMGNPHCVAFVPQASDAMVLGLGPKIECDPRFPRKTNVEFVEVISPTELRQRTWERGSGETWACGTGASAVCVAGVLTGTSQRDVLIHLLGGDLNLRWDESTGHVFMTGGATEVFSGDWT